MLSLINSPIRARVKGRPLSTLTQAPAGPRRSQTAVADDVAFLARLEDHARRELFVPQPRLELYLFGCPSPITAVIDSGAVASLIGINHWGDWQARCPILQDRWCGRPPSSIADWSSPSGGGRFAGLASNVPLFAKPDDALVTVDFMVTDDIQAQVLLGQRFIRKYGAFPALEPATNETVVRFPARTRASELQAAEMFEYRQVLKPNIWVEAGQYHADAEKDSPVI